MSWDLKETAFFLVGNIPAHFRSANLRAFFSQYAEKGAFACFHYRHRPEHAKQSVRGPGEGLGAQGEASSREKRTKGGGIVPRCCVIAVKKEFGEDFSKMYGSKNWSHQDGSLLAGRVRLAKLNIAAEDAVEGEAGEKLQLKYGKVSSN